MKLNFRDQGRSPLGRPVCTGIRLENFANSTCQLERPGASGWPKCRASGSALFSHGSALAQPSRTPAHDSFACLIRVAHVSSLDRSSRTHARQHDTPVFTYRHTHPRRFAWRCAYDARLPYASPSPTQAAAAARRPPDAAGHAAWPSHGNDAPHASDTARR